MNGIEKNHLVKSLCKLAAAHCCYIGKSCDCKYIEDYDPAKITGEKSGCPELTMAATLISHMTDQEFLAIAHRAGITIIKDEDFCPLDILNIIFGFKESNKK